MVCGLKEKLDLSEGGSEREEVKVVLHDVCCTQLVEPVIRGKLLTNSSMHDKFCKLSD